MKLKRTIFPLIFRMYFIEIHLSRKHKRCDKLLIHRRI